MFLSKTPVTGLRGRWEGPTGPEFYGNVACTEYKNL